MVELDVVLTAHHMGHFTYKACAINAGEVASQECFDSNPLTFVEDVLYGSLPDPDNADRAYIPRSDAAFIQKDNNGQEGGEERASSLFVQTAEEDLSFLVVVVINNDNDNNDDNDNDHDNNSLILEG